MAKAQQENIWFDKQRLIRIVEPLLAWYGKNARVLPWREQPTPYRVWISEIMLQQTRVEAVKPYFERFIARLPDVAALANVEEDELLKLWEGLGYYSRARNLQRAAQQIMRLYGGNLPADPAALLALPGVGEYTAGAVASIAFGLPVPAVDGNVLRVFARVTASQGDITSPQVRAAARNAAQAVIPADRPGDFNQALMELGATVCLPNGAPQCLLCPVRELCAARQEGQEGNLPVRAPKKPRRVEQRTVFVLCSEDGRIALHKRPSKGLLAGLWELPNVEGWLTPEEAGRFAPRLCLGPAQPLGEAKHIFTHVEWRMIGYRLPARREELEKGWVWASEEQLMGEFALPSAFCAYLPKRKNRTE
ncbi:MAG TPA: A/G-specific adenine glycosylase [Candidatus Gallacutalibacter stercoravium]|nr:A/G-specific adenine glycosylase [Candidatus Gallacutalibacter stercoravium]